ncbi:hypothetical protein C0214_00110 [Methylobacterium sp. DM1]|nr:hypothetical protein C0214_00110 [Methylobacterium sp. DM1]
MANERTSGMTCQMAVIEYIPLPSVVCTISERRVGDRVRIEAQIRSDKERAGIYELQVTKSGPAGSAQVIQRSDFTLDPGTPLQIQGLSLSLEPHGQYRARLLIRTDNTEYGCKREGPDAADPIEAHP